MSDSNPVDRRMVRVRIAMLAVVFAIALASVLYYLRARSYESTDNAFIDGDVIQVSPRVAGQVLRVCVTDNQHVNKGDVLAEIDPRDYETRLAEAKGKLADIAARVTSSQTAVQLTSTVTGAVLVQASAGYDATRDQAEVLKARLQQDDASIHTAEALLQQSEARVKAAEAEAARAAADAERYRQLFAKDEVSKQVFDRAQTDARSTSANLERQVSR